MRILAISVLLVLGFTFTACNKTDTTPTASTTSNVKVGVATYTFKGKTYTVSNITTLVVDSLFYNITDDMVNAPGFDLRIAEGHNLSTGKEVVLTQINVVPDGESWLGKSNTNTITVTYYNGKMNGEGLLKGTFKGEVDQENGTAKNEPITGSFEAIVF